MQTSIAYDENQVKYDGTKEDTKKGFKLWIDIVNPTPSEISEIRKVYDLDDFAVEALKNKSKKPQIRVLDNHKFTIILDDVHSLCLHLIFPSMF